MKRLLTGIAFTALAATSASAELLDLEKDELTFGFIKLTDMAPLAVAYEQGYFLDEGLFVTLEAQANWKVLLDRVITFQLACASISTIKPSSSKKPFSFAITSGAQSVSLMKPNLS